ncbi:MAG: DUF3142 domain-containing protein [Acidobacteria bacterium]|nr:DUF3142 domain-containing protein [Acidobacteriota bacterium]
MSKKVKLLLVLVLILGGASYWLITKLNPSFSLFNSPKVNERLAKLPKIMLWAWERPENLKFIDSSTTGVAFLARTISLKNSDIAVRPRLQVLEVPPNTTLIAVVRIETDIYQKPSFSLEQKEKTLEVILSLTNLKNIVGLQIDFDAKLSEREFYKELLKDLRKRLPSNYLLSITALASWAIYDDWIRDLPIDEAVPMLFRMGIGGKEVTKYLESKKDFTLPVAKTSLGISTSSELPWLPPKRRVYIFAESSWSKDLLNDSLKKVELWQTK